MSEKKSTKKPGSQDGEGATSRARGRKADRKGFFVETAQSRAKRSVDSLESRLFGDQEQPPEPPGPESSTADRVEHCMLLMVRGVWNGYATRVELSKVWRVVDSTIRDYSAEASRLLKLDPEEIEAARISHAFFCERVRREALSMTNQVTGLPDFAAVLKADERIAKYRGIDVDKTKVELTGKDGGPIETRTPTIMIPPEVEE